MAIMLPSQKGAKMIIIGISEEERGSLFWGLPLEAENAIAQMPEDMQKAVQADMEGLLEGFVSLVLANLTSNTFLQRGFQPLQTTLVVGSAELGRRLEELSQE